MTRTTLLVLVFGYAVFAATFTAVAWKRTSHAKLIGLITIGLCAPFFYRLGAFTEQFSAGLCYSSAIDKIATAVGETQNPALLAQKIQELPLVGYETNCRELELAAGKLRNAVAPNISFKPNPRRELA